MIINPQLLTQHHNPDFLAGQLQSLLLDQPIAFPVPREVKKNYYTHFVPI